MKTANKVNHKWSEYDQVVGANQLDTFGIIFLDDYGCPIDNEYEVEDLWDKYNKGQK